MCPNWSFDIPACAHKTPSMYTRSSKGVVINDELLLATRWEWQLFVLRRNECIKRMIKGEVGQSLDCSNLLTSWYQVILCSLGLALILHSKYTSSPSLISSGLRVVPSFSCTWGGSEKDGLMISRSGLGLRLFENSLLWSGLITLIVLMITWNTSNAFFI